MMLWAFVESARLASHESLVVLQKRRPWVQDRFGHEIDQAFTIRRVLRGLVTMDGRDPRGMNLR